MRSSLVHRIIGTASIWCMPAKQEKMSTAKSHWVIPKDRKKDAEEVIEEDRQYLEEVTF